MPDTARRFCYPVQGRSYEGLDFAVYASLVGLTVLAIGCLQRLPSAYSADLSAVDPWLSSRGKRLAVLTTLVLPPPTIHAIFQIKPMSVTGCDEGDRRW